MRMSHIVMRRIVMRHIVICGLARSIFFSHYPTKDIVLEKKVTEHKTLVLISSTTFV